MTLLDTQAAAMAVAVPAGTIRRWAHNGWITRQGKDPKGRTLYDADEVDEFVKATRAGR